MAKSTYLSNSAKILAALSGMLLLANILIAVGSIGGIASVSKLATSYSEFCRYVVLVVGFIAFNGEAVCHKRERDRKKKKLLGFFKLLLLICFLSKYIKVVPENLAMTIPAEALGGILARLGVSLLSTVGSFGFLFGTVSLWYLIRDRENQKLLLPELLAVMVGFVYNTFKFFNYAVGKYGITAFGEGFTAILSQNSISQILCIFHFLITLIMLIMVTVQYSKMGEGEQQILDKNTKELKKARNVLKEEGYGIDSFEDDFLTTDN